jgi:hypothetical protein
MVCTNGHHLKASKRVLSYMWITRTDRDATHVSQCS